MKQPSRRRYDPDRRNRIIEAALDVIEIHGVAGATHRRIAEAANVPLGRLGQPEDVAAAVAFLTSPGAGYISGTTIHVNGGMYMN